MHGEGNSSTCGWSSASTTISFTELKHGSTSFESWRKLEDACGRKAGTRAAGPVVRILTVEFDMSDLLNSLEKWENLFKQHDATVNELRECKNERKLQH